MKEYKKSKIVTDLPGWFFGVDVYDNVKSEVDIGRPIVLHLESNIGWSGHAVVAYAYSQNTHGVQKIKVNMGWWPGTLDEFYTVDNIYNQYTAIGTSKVVVQN